MTSPSRDHSLRRLSLFSPKKKALEESGFTLIELVMVIIIISLIFAIGLRSDASFFLWRQDASISKLTETIQFLHHQAVRDQAYYRIEFDFTNNSYQAGVLRQETQEDLANLVTDAGTLSLELSAFLSPSPGRTFTFIPSPNYPSLYQSTKLEGDIELIALKNFSGEHTKKHSAKASITFSPRGFSEFAVLHFLIGGSGEKTVLVNPFSGLTSTYNGYREFEWTYGSANDSA